MRQRTDGWRAEAACAGNPDHPPETWDGEIAGELRNPQDRLGKQARLARYQAAVRVCRSECPVLEQCMKDARHRGDVGVIRGGEPFGIPTAEATRIRTPRARLPRAAA